MDAHRLAAVHLDGRDSFSNQAVRKHVQGLGAVAGGAAGAPASYQYHWVHDLRRSFRFIGGDLRHDRIGQVGLFLSEARRRYAGVRSDRVDQTRAGVFGAVWMDRRTRREEEKVRQRAEELLRYVNIDTSVIRRDYQKLVEHPSLSAETRKELLEELEAGLQGYAYLEDE